MRRGVSQRTCLTVACSRLLSLCFGAAFLVGCCWCAHIFCKTVVRAKHAGEDRKREEEQRNGRTTCGGSSRSSQASCGYLNSCSYFKEPFETKNDQVADQRDQKLKDNPYERLFRMYDQTVDGKKFASKKPLDLANMRHRHNSAIDGRNAPPHPQVQC